MGLGTGTKELEISRPVMVVARLGSRVLFLDSFQSFLYIPGKTIDFFALIDWWINTVVIDRHSRKRIIEIAWKKMQMEMWGCVYVFIGSSSFRQ